VFERFTDRSRRVLVLAQEEARLSGHNFIGTEHLLLGLIQEREGIAARALMGLDITLDEVRTSVEAMVGPGGGQPFGSPPFTPRAKKALDLSIREALQLGHSYIGPEHMLLGLLREGEGVAAQVLQHLGADLPGVRQAVLTEMSGYQGLSSEGGQPARISSPQPRCTGCSLELEGVLRYRSMAIPPTPPDSLPLKVEVVYCSSCGHVFSMFRAEVSE
jgi:ATP-dependent Clp protease ATP-binding subunit ClpC